MILNFCKGVENNDFFVHNENSAQIFEKNCKDFQEIRGMMYYFMEDLPYIPTDMQAQWFDIEVSMLQRAIESAERLTQSYSKVNAKADEFLEMSNMYRIGQLRKLSILHEQKPGSLEYINALKIKRNYNYDQYANGLHLTGQLKTQNSKWLEKNQDRRITSDESFEMSRDYLYPAIDFNFETQN